MSPTYSQRGAIHSIKFHWPLHWWLTRREFGCSANEKSLERMLGEAQKTHFKHTNSCYDVEVPSIHYIHVVILFHAIVHMCYKKYRD
jgi:hypothetical protein